MRRHPVAAPCSSAPYRARVTTLGEGVAGPLYARSRTLSGVQSPPMPIYLDHAATTPLRPEVLERMLPLLTEQFGNPSSAHAFGRKARSALDEAHEVVARCIDAQPREIVFTSGGTEASNLAIKG